MYVPLSERVKKIILDAKQEARRFDHDFLSTEHLLLRLTKEWDSVAGRILDRVGVSLRRLRSEVEREMTRGEVRLIKDMQMTPRARRVMDLAYKEAQRMNSHYVGTEHLLLGLILEGDGVAGAVLHRQKADLECVRAEIARLTA
jgi:ATP-dependent Clp protease ATP-binding subunit ClpC